MKSSSKWLSFTNSILGSGGQGAQAFKNTVGRFIQRPMTREEACQILSIEPAQEIDPAEVMKVCFSHLILLHLSDANNIL